MRIDEPMTMATDYVLAAATAIFGVLLWKAARETKSRAIRYWALAFFFTSLASLSGGSFHGFQHALAPGLVAGMWKITVYAIGFGSFFLLVGAILAGTSGQELWRNSLVGVAILELIIYVVWVARYDDFIYVIADYGSSLILIAILETIAWARSRAASAPWILGSIALSVVGAAIQARGVSIHRNFNHNDLYHVVQLAALWMLYQGGRRFPLASPAVAVDSSGA